MIGTQTPVFSEGSFPAPRFRRVLRNLIGKVSQKLDLKLIELSAELNSTELGVQNGWPIEYQRYTGCAGSYGPVRRRATLRLKFDGLLTFGILFRLVLPAPR